MFQITDLGALSIQLGAIIFAIEALVELIKLIAGSFIVVSDKAKQVIAIVVGVIVAAALKISIFETDNQVLLYLGSVVAGAVASRGADGLHSAIGILRSLKK